MLLIDDLLLLPFSGFNFVLRTLQKVASEQYTDDAPLKQRLLELQLQLDTGDISEKEYVKQEAGIIRELREVQKRKRELAGLPEEEQGGLRFGRGSAEASVSVTMHQDVERKR